MNRVAVSLGLAAAVVLSCPTLWAQTGPASSLDELLRRARAGARAESAENQKREAEFLAAKERQEELLVAAKAKREQLQQRAEDLEKQFNANEAEITRRQETLKIRLGTMGELFGVIRQVAGETRSRLDSSLVSAQYPKRTEKIDVLARSQELPSVDQLEHLWEAFAMEMVQSGKVVRYPTEVEDTGGKRAVAEVVRVGVFNAVANGKYLKWEPEVGKLLEFTRQPPAPYLSGVEALEAAKEGFVRFAVDPTRGQLLAQKVLTPSFMESIPYGGIIGYITIVLGVIALLIGIALFFYFLAVYWAVGKQRGIKRPSLKNPLGRILHLYTSDPDVDTETLERRLDEAIIRESAKMDRFLWLVKIVSIVAPLLGLLGTVTGMIRTFQAITMVGTGDPQQMAGGISEALVTTMLGLYVAIPLTLLYSGLKSISGRVIDIIEEHSAGLVARRAEEEKRGVSLPR